MYNLFKGNVGLNKLKIIAKKIAINSIPGDVILLKGNLGSGKTTFARFFINSIFDKYLHSKPNFIKSPSYPIMINYNLINFDVFHYDFYRIKNANELAELDIYENIINNITLIEWPEIIINEGQLNHFFIIKLEIINSIKRKIEILHTNNKELINEK